MLWEGRPGPNFVRCSYHGVGVRALVRGCRRFSGLANHPNAASERNPDSSDIVGGPPRADCGRWCGVTNRGEGAAYRFCVVGDASGAEVGRQRLRVSALVTTLTLENAIAAPAITGLSKPAAASGIPTTL